MKLCLRCICICLLWPLLSVAQKTDTIHINSLVLKEDIEVWVTRPEGYDTLTGRLPLLVALDADALQEYMPMYVKYLSRPFERSVPPLLVAAIRSKSPRWRARNFIPKLGIDSLDNRPDRGHADELLQLISEELLPLINTRYRTSDLRVLAGHSLAGLFGIYAMYKDPGLFRAVLAVSPSPMNGLIADTYLPAIAGQVMDSPRYLYFSVATNDNPGYLEGSMKMKMSMEAHPQQNIRWKQEIFTDKTHWTTAPPAFYNALLWLFAQKP